MSFLKEGSNPQSPPSLKDFIDNFIDQLSTNIACTPKFTRYYINGYFLLMDELAYQLNIAKPHCAPSSKK